MSDSFFIGNEIHERKVITPKGPKAVWFKELPNTAHLRFQAEIRSADSVVQSTAMARFVSQSLCEPDGTLSLNLEKACQLRTPILQQMYAHVRDLDKGDDPGKESPPAEPSGSGTPSPSPSAAEQ